MEKVISALFASKVPAVFWGPPGVGKTAVLERFAKKVGAELIVPTVRSPEDIAVPVIRDGGVVVVPVGEFLRAAADDGRPRIVFIDEISTMPPAVQAAALRFLDSGLVGGVRIPPTVWRVAAANPPDMAADGWELSPPVANRLVHVQWKLDVDEWVSGFPSYWGTPPRIPGLEEEAWAQARALVAGFIKARPHLLLRVPNSEQQRGGAWPSPRTWDLLSRAWAAAPDDETRIALAVGAVGEGAGMEFAAWAREADLPDPEELLANPAAFKMPPRDDVLFAILAAVVAAAIRNLTPGRWEAAWDIIGLAASQRPDVAAFAARELAKARRSDLPLPTKQIQPLLPVLRGAGLL